MEMVLSYIFYYSEISNSTTRATFVMDFQSTSTITNAILLNRFVDFYTVTATTMSSAAVTEDNNNNSTGNITDAEATQGNKVKLFITARICGKVMFYTCLSFCPWRGVYPSMPHRSHDRALYKHMHC